MGLVNWIISEVGRIVAGLLDLLPDSPFRGVELNSLGQYAGWVNYFIPVGRILGLLVVWLGAVSVWYFLRWVLRMVRYID